MSDLKRLSKLAGILDEEVIRCAFVVGFPLEISAQLRSSNNAMSCSIHELLDRARMLVVRVDPEVEMTCAVASTESSRPGQTRRPFRVHCYVCRGPHLAKACPSREQLSVERRSCFVCGEVGHISRNCERRGNDSGKTSAPAASL
jgi:hypothetical protein